MLSFFRTVRNIISQIDEYYNCIDQGNLVFEEGISCYITGNYNIFSEKIKKIEILESTADNLRRMIDSTLYEKSLLPQHRSDILRLLDLSDNTLNMIKAFLINLEIEHPDIPDDIKSLFLELSAKTKLCVEAFACSARSYFRDFNALKEKLHRIYFYEKECDVIGLKIKKLIFNTLHIELSQKSQLRYFVNYIENISDSAEDVADVLAILAIKRDV